MRLPLRPAALVNAWFDLLPGGQAPTARALHAVLLDAAPQLGQAVKWGHLVLTLDGLHALALAPHRNGLHLQVFRGGELTGDFPMLEGNGRGMRHLRLRYGHPVDEELVRALVSAVLSLPPDERRRDPPQF